MIIAKQGSAEVRRNQAGNLIGSIGSAPAYVKITSQRDAAKLLDCLDEAPTAEQRREFCRKVALALAEQGTRIRRRGKLSMFGRRA